MKPKKISGVLLLFSFTALCLTVPGRADTIAWTNLNGGNWSVAANWSPNVVPGSADDVLITSIGTYIVTLDTSPTINSLTLGAVSGEQTLTNAGFSLTLNTAGTIETNGILTMAGGTLTGNNTVSGTLIMNRGMIDGSLTELDGGVINATNVTLFGGAVTNGGTMNWNGVQLGPISMMTVLTNGVLNVEGDVTLFSVLTNQGTVHWRAGQVAMYNYSPFGWAAEIWNETNALWDIQCDQPILNYSGDEQFNNTGRVLKSAGIGTTGFNLDFSNTGTLDAESGVMSLNATFDLTGGTMNFGISSPTTYGRIYLSNNPSALGGSISAQLNNGYVPAGGDAFQLLSYPSFTGSFTNTNLPPVAVWQTTYGSTALTISVQNLAVKLVPTITWPNPADITYGASLTSAQLNATAASPANPGVGLSGTFIYNPPLGTVLQAGNNQTLSVTFMPTDTADFMNVTASVTINVQQAPLLVTADSTSKTYGQTRFIAGTEFTTTGLVNGDTVTSVSLTSGGVLSTATVTGSPYAIVPSAAAGSGLVNYTITYGNGALTVMPAGVTIGSGITANNKVYDRTTAATLNFNSVVLLGVVNGDTVTLNTSGYGANFASAGVGSGVALSVSGLTLGGANAANYTLTQPAGLTANITAAGVTIGSGLKANDKVYDRTTAATLNFNNVSLLGVVNGDTVTFNTSGYSANFASAGVGSGIAVSVSGLTLGGANAANYTLTQPAGLTANITAAGVTIGSGLTANNKVYDRTTAATLNFNSVVLLGVVNGDTVTLNTSGYGANFASAGVGSGIGVSVSGLTLGGGSAANYTLTQPAGLTANITAAGVTISSGITANNKVYDRTTAATLNFNSVALLGVVNGDTVTLNTSGYGANFASAGVGSGIGVSVSGLTLGGANAANYTLTQPAGLTANITAAGVTIGSGLTANNKVYDRTTAATLNFNNVSLLGVVNGDTVTLNTSGYGANFASTGVGSGVAVSVSGLTLGGASAGNYTLTQPAGLTANITAAGVTIGSGITANDKVYDGSTAATLNSNSVVLLGVITGDTVSLNINRYIANFASASVGNGIAVIVSGLTLTGASAGNYSLTQPASLVANITIPTVQIVAVLPNIVITWTTNATDFVLVQTASLTPPVRWLPVTNSIMVNGGYNTVTVDASAGNQYFDLVAAP